MTAKRKETGAAYLRVGTTIYKRVQQPLSSGRSIEILLAWNVETLRQDFGKDYLARIPKYDGFCTVPTTRTTGGRSTAFESLRTDPLPAGRRGFPAHPRLSVAHLRRAGRDGV